MTRPILGCFGDLMTTLPGGALPEPHRTRPIPLEKAALGGSALNLTFHLASLGRTSRLLAAHGTNQASRLRKTLDETPSSLEFVVQIDHPPDTLVIFEDEEATRSFYLHAALPSSAVEALLGSASACDWLVFCGSRHGELSGALCEALRDGCRSAFVFAPSYSAYDIEPAHLEIFLKSASIVALNENEDLFMRCETTLGHLLDDPEKTYIRTLGDRGAVIRTGDAAVEIASVSGMKGDRQGAGDAFLAGYLHGRLAGFSDAAAGGFGARAAAAILRGGDERARLDPKAFDLRPEDADRSITPAPSP